jgi:hypothetical protein
MIWAMARASLRSVLFDIAPIAAFACCDSMQIVGHPAAVNSPCNQAVIELASSPTRSKDKLKLARRARSASGSLAARASLIIRPVSSTTQIAVSSKDTSIPTKYFMAAPLRCLWRFDTDHVLTS